MPGQPTPPLITIPWANSEANPTYVRAIPTTSQIGIQDAAASWPDGFPPKSMTPVSGGGVAPWGQDMNGILQFITKHLCALQAGQPYTFSSTLASTLSGYALGATLANSDGSGLWVNSTNGNSADPEAAGVTTWFPLTAYDYYSVTGLTNSNVTLTQLQGAKNVIALSGTLSGNVQIILPTRVGHWLIVNLTTGAFVITVKYSSGTGVTVPQGGPNAPTPIWGNGTNIYYAVSVPWSTVTATPTTLAGYGIGSVAWSVITGTPTTLGGYGISAVPWANLTGVPTTIGGYGISVLPWANVTGRPTTVGGYGITDAITTTGGQVINGSLGLSSYLTAGDVYASRGSNVGVCFLGSSGVHYVYFNGSQYEMPGGTLTVAGGDVYSVEGKLAPVVSPTFIGSPLAPTASPGTNNTVLATTAFVQTALANLPFKVAAGRVIGGALAAGSVGVTGITNYGTGGYDIDFTAAGFTQNPACVATAITDVFGNPNVVHANVVSSAGAFAFYYIQAVGGYPGDFSFVCIGV